ncbi:MAG: bifunctional precorrin-2 dehydrogenase/sirohydrochlorin ferrochelatase [Desulfovibrio sp.]|nr:bifunctional precorrin-2 dehydrogenase/sirohydrochlorin ferrochelatase [Desulfovibrio sp.]
MLARQSLTEQRYHIALSLKGKRCLLAGFGAVGKRKLARLLAMGDAGPEAILVLDPNLPDCQEDSLLQAATVHGKRQKVSCQDLDVHLVFACTGSKEENARIARLCAERGILCNCASDPALGDVQLPALINCPPLTITLSTQGASPALAKKWRLELEQWAAKKRPILCLMAWLRPKILALGLPQAENRRLFTSLAQGPLEDWLACGQRQKASDYLLALLPQALHKDLQSLFSEQTEVWI